MRLFKSKRGSPAHRRVVVEVVRWLRTAGVADRAAAGALASATAPPSPRASVKPNSLELELAADDA